MSIRAMSAVIDHSETQGSTFLVLLILADHANGDGRCWPTAERIAARSRVSRSTVFRAIEELERLGELKRETRGKQAGGPNVYRVMPGYVDDSLPHSPKGVGQPATGVGQPDTGGVGQPDTGVGHARHEGGGSTVTHRTVRNRKEPRADFVSRIPEDFDPDFATRVAEAKAKLSAPRRKGPAT